MIHMHGMVHMCMDGTAMVLVERKNTFLASLSERERESASLTSK